MRKQDGKTNGEIKRECLDLGYHAPSEYFQEFPEQMLHKLLDDEVDGQHREILGIEVPKGYFTAFQKDIWTEIGTENRSDDPLLSEIGVSKRDVSEYRRSDSIASKLMAPEISVSKNRTSAKMNFPISKKHFSSVRIFPYVASIAAVLIVALFFFIESSQNTGIEHQGASPVSDVQRDTDRPYYNDEDLAILYDDMAVETIFMDDNEADAYLDDHVLENMVLEDLTLE